MKVLFLSDFHNCVDSCSLERVCFSCPLPDVVFTMGDISLRELVAIRDLFQTSPIYGIRGNHDGHSSLDLADIFNIHSKSIKLGDTIFAGFEGSVRYKRGDYIMFSQKESLDVALDVPAADILVSHDRSFCGPYSDISAEYSKSPHEGLIGITSYLQKHSPRLHVHGHIHKNQHYTWNGIDTLSVFGAVLVSFENKVIKDYQILFEP